MTFLSQSKKIRQNTFESVRGVIWYITCIMYDNTHPEKELNQNVFKHMPEHVIVCSLSIAIILFSSLGG